MRQVAVFDIEKNERRLIKTNESFNAIRITALLDSFSNSNTDSFKSCDFVIKSKSFNGNLYDLKCLNTIERVQKYRELQYAEDVSAMMSINGAQQLDYSNLPRQLAYNFVVYLSDIDEMEFAYLTSNTNFKEVNVELLKDDSMHYLCHKWNLGKEIVCGSDYSQEVKEERTYAITLDYRVRCFIDRYTKLVCEDGTYNNVELCALSSTRQSGSWNTGSLLVPAVWFGKLKDFTLVKNFYGGDCKQVKLFYYVD